ncbi:MAG: alpha/beta hydrolase-fold protein [Gemmatimonadales bacterium]
MLTLHRLRDALVALSLAGGTLGATGCPAPAESYETGGGTSHLTARIVTAGASATTGAVSLGLASGRDGTLFVPSNYRPGVPMPLLLALHGAGQAASEMLSILQGQAEQNGFLLLAVDSRDATWDGIRGSFGPDVSYINRALQFAFDRYNVQVNHIGVAGFSDGASYALTIGLTNGDLFSRVIAFSPGFIPASDSPAAGKPPFFISHGRQDQILSYDNTAGGIVPNLQARGYAVTFAPFDGRHTVTAATAAAAAAWFAQ